MSEPASFSLEPLTEQCASICARKEHVVLGVSPGNSYFRVALLTDLLRWLSGNFARVDVVVPDAALIHTFTALGYAPDRAAGKVRAEINVLRNRVARAWTAAGGPRGGDGAHLMSELTDRAAYRKALAECEAALLTDAELRAACRAASREVLLSRRPATEPADDEVETGLRYLLAELPFFVASADIFDAPSSLTFYHRPFPLADLIFSRRTGLAVSARQAYALIRPVDLAVETTTR
ncbi:tRNA-dependent cyclodipeptide synthase [Streptomyces sp. NPDC017454]|uniref:tRNA-dependent cyclodipeptide synthase n=1 Tax=Streptomyces sp. NPDC017454 TaxID=3364997 RepID=UPI0037A7C09D